MRSVKAAADEARSAVSALVSDLLETGLALEETHISWVFLGEREVWKVKKPVDLGFLDFTTLESRRAACAAEVRLNRRLAPDVYLGVVPIVADSRGRHRIGPSASSGVDALEPVDDAVAEVVDWAVHMRRLDHADRADRRLENGRLDAEDLSRVARILADFHATARVDAATARFGTAESIEVNVRENFEQGQRTIDHYLRREQVEEIQAWQMAFLDAHDARFDDRRASGRVRDGHGDLRLEHVYLRGDEIRIIDCIEFNERFRFADICADIAFLAMDLTWHGRPDLAERFLAAYARHSGDYELYPLVDFYESYRAFVRGKIAAFVAASDTDPRRRARARVEARRYYLLALAAERRTLVPPRVIAVGGVIASGKSTIADHLGAALAAPVVDSDRTRKQLLGVDPTRPVEEPAFAGAYAPSRSEAVYDEVLHRADAVLRSRRSVVIDASFRARAARAAAADLARRHHVPFTFVECRAAPEVCRQRLARRAESASVSDGRLAIFDDFVARFEPVDELGPDEHLVVDTAKDLDSTLAGLDEALGIDTRDPGAGC